MVERLHGTIKDRTKPMRGLKSFESTKDILEGYTIHYNYVRPHQSLNGKTPAQVARMDTPDNWKSLIEEATKYEVRLLATVTRTRAKKGEAIKVIAK